VRDFGGGLHGLAANSVCEETSFPILSL